MQEGVESDPIEERVPRTDGDNPRQLRYAGTFENIFGNFGGWKMADRVWYFAVGGNRQGPISEDDLHARIASGEIKADTLVWNSGMADWARAGTVPGLIGPGAPAMPPGAPALPRTAIAEADGGQQGQPLSTSVGTWGLFGRSVLVIIGSLLVIPTPWVMTMFYRWFIPQIVLPNGRRVTFGGEAGDIWHIFMLQALLGYAGFVHKGLPFLLIPLNVLFNFMVVRWILGKLRWDGQAEPLRFTGSYWGLLGWIALLWVSIISLIGWAWVVTAMTRWMCRNIEGSREQLSFVASGFGVLGHFALFTLTCVFVIPIPWMLAWLTRWMVSQFHLSQRA